MNEGYADDIIARRTYRRMMPCTTRGSDSRKSGGVPFSRTLCNYISQVLRANADGDDLDDLSRTLQLDRDAIGCLSPFV